MSHLSIQYRVLSIPSIWKCIKYIASVIIRMYLWETSIKYLCLSPVTFELFHERPKSC